MKKTLKVFLIYLFIFFLLSIGQAVNANSIKKISMDIYVDSNGDAHVTEIWNCNVNKGTEVYHPYYNLGTSEIKDFTVFEGDKEYTTLNSWNINGDLSSKAYKCGINKINNGLELCWGISKYGSHTYVAKYTITNFVSELVDSQMIYWTLIPYDFSNSIGDMYIKIHTDFNIPDTVGVWGYGNYGGTAYVYDGYIEMQSDGALSTDEYMTILVKFPTGTFNCDNKIDYYFNYYLNMAEEGAVKYIEKENYEFKTIGFVIILCIGVILFRLFTTGIIKIENENFDFGPWGKRFSKDLGYYRDIPCGKDIFRAYYIAIKYKISKKKENLLGAIILKWVKDDIVQIIKKEESSIFKKENIIIKLPKENKSLLENEKEQQLFDMLYIASNDGILEGKEFEKWCKKFYKKIILWFNSIIRQQENILIVEGMIEKDSKMFLGSFRKRKNIATEALRREAEKLEGLKRFLLDFSMVDEREVMEVRPFEEYLIYAQILGIADKVAKEFEDIYPEIIEESKYIHYDNIMFIDLCTHRGMTQAYRAKSEAEAEERAKARGYSSGGGGFSSGGGGGGSFGGGGGGGGFR